MTVEQTFGVSLEELKASDVMGKQPDKDAQELEKKIKNARKGSTLQIKLTADEVQKMTNEAIKNGFDDWKAYVTAEVKDKVLNCLVGTPKINGPSTVKQGKIKGPSNGLGSDYGF